MDQFRDQVVLITGAGRGTGRMLAEAFAAKDAVVAANDITPINLDETIQGIKQAGGRVKDYVFDISKKMPVQAMLNQVIDDWGQLDILINNAHVDPKKGLLDLDEWDWRRAVDVNLTGAFLVAQSAARIMKEAGCGVIVNVLSGGDGHSALKVCQMGLLGLTKELADEFNTYNIRVNAVITKSLGSSSEESSNFGIIDNTLQLCSLEAESINGKIFVAEQEKA